MVMNIPGDLPFLAVKSNRDGGYACRKHSHEEVSLGYIISGKTTVDADGQRFMLHAGDFILIPAETAHLCLPEDEKAYRFQMAYLSAGWWNSRMDIKANRFRTLAVPASEDMKRLFASFEKGAFTDIETEIVSVLKCIENRIPPAGHNTDGADEAVHELHRSIKNLPEMHRGIDEYARDHGMSRFSLIRKYAHMYGLTPHADRINMRIQRAILLFESDRNLTQIAYACGFSDQSHFIRYFKQYSGMQPGEYRTALLSNSE